MNVHYFRKVSIRIFTRTCRTWMVARHGGIGLDPNLWPSNSRSKSLSTIFAMTQFDSKCQNIQTSFFSFLIFAKVWLGRTIVTHRQTHTHTLTHPHTHRNEQAHGYGRNLADLLTYQYSLFKQQNSKSLNYSSVARWGSGVHGPNSEIIIFNGKWVKWPIQFIKIHEGL